ncbi:MAG: AAA family ATPase [Planctomycetaceae bacterium]|nr:AAA family ATPase [Planctomycetaceae bacterium]
MYLNHWQLSRRPFESGIDSAAYYPSEPHQSALLKLRYVVEQGTGVAVLGGISGVGKSLLVQLLQPRLGESFQPWAHLVYPQLDTPELLGYIAAELECDAAQTTSLDRTVRAIGRRLVEWNSQGRRPVLAIDEAHLLTSRDTFESLRLLLNFEHAGRPALSLVLIGQPGLFAQLERLPQLDERIAVKCLLRPLTVEETMSYVQHRLAWAGARRTIFTTTALEALHRLSQGVPRRIHRLCDLALLVGFAEEQRQVTDRHLEAVAHELVEIAA